MERRILLVGPDADVLSHASAVLGYAGCRILTELQPAETFAVARHWLPHVVVIALDRLEAWEADFPDNLRRLQENSCLLVTVDRAEPAHRWRRWAQAGCEVLVKPIRGAWQLHEAVKRAEGNTPFVFHRDLPARPDRAIAA